MSGYEFRIGKTVVHVAADGVAASKWIEEWEQKNGERFDKMGTIHFQGEAPMLPRMRYPLPDGLDVRFSIILDEVLDHIERRFPSLMEDEAVRWSTSFAMEALRLLGEGDLPSDRGADSVIASKILLQRGHTLYLSSLEKEMKVTLGVALDELPPNVYEAVCRVCALIQWVVWENTRTPRWQKELKTR